MALLDATFLIDLMRGRERAVDMLERLEAEGEALDLSAVTLFELFRGLDSVELPAAEKRRVAEAVLGRVVHPLDARVAQRAGGIDAQLWRAGEPIDPEDACVAGTALAHDRELVTRKGREFGRVEGLRLRTY